MTVRVSRAGLLPASARKPGLVAAACRETLRRERVRREGEINIVFMDRKSMKTMNKEFLGHDYDTDVIAFNYDLLTSPKGAEAPFGDVYISSYKAREQAKEQGHSVLKEVLTLVVHGTLHLLGYDDDTPSRKARMFQKQDEILAQTLR